MQATIGVIRGELKLSDEFKIIKDTCIDLRNQNIDMTKRTNVLERDMIHKMRILDR